MNSKQLLFSWVLGLLSFSLSAQEKSKTFKETFNVTDKAVLKINTSHADIEFETWDKDQVEITAVIELDGASEEEASAYFKKMPIEIIGNSREIEINTNMRSGVFPGHLTANWADIRSSIEHSRMKLESLKPLFLDLELPELPELAVLSEMPEMPPVPPIAFKFDYEEFKKDGDAYMEKWKKEFDENFDKKYQKRMEEWGERMEERAKKWQERNAARLEGFEKRAEERAKLMEERQKALEERREAYEVRRNELVRKRRLKQGNNDNYPEVSEDIIHLYSDDEGPKTFFFSSDGEGKKFKVKKAIKIKMPKSVKLKMNVKHGEVKLASLTKNMNASLRYASLLASTIDGKNTDIMASYSPLYINEMLDGQVNVKYCEKVDFKKVRNLKLNSVSSNIVLAQALRDVEIKNDYGQTEIKNISPDAKRIYVKIIDGELTSSLPKGEYNLYLFDEYSNVSYPKHIEVERATSSHLNGDFVTSGPNKKKYPSIIINAKYADVVLKE